MNPQILNDLKWGTIFFLGILALVLFGSSGPQIIYAMF